MISLRTFGMLLAAVASAACVSVSAPSAAPTLAPATVVPGTGAPATVAPATVAPATPAPVTPAPATIAPATAEPLPTDAPPTPSEGLDPSLSDAGVVGRITIDGEEREPDSPRNGTHDIIGSDADGSSCGLSFDGTEYTAVAWHYEAPNNEPRQMFAVVSPDDVPATDGTTADITDGRAGADFNSESGFGTLYYGDATEADEGHAKIDVTRIGALLVFDYEGVTWDDVTFYGQMICAEG